MKIAASKTNLAEFPATDVHGIASRCAQEAKEGVSPVSADWLYPVWSARMSSGPSSTNETWTNWSQPREGPSGSVKEHVSYKRKLQSLKVCFHN